MANFKNPTIIIKKESSEKLDGMIDGSLSGAINSNVITVRDHAFYKMQNITSVSFPNATDIGTQAFNYCTNLLTANLPLITTLKSGIFQYTKLNGIICPLVTTIENFAFDNTQLGSFNFTNVTSVGNTAFRLTKLTTITFSSVIATISANAFLSCQQLTSVTFQGNVPAIQNNTFGSCNSVMLYDFSNATSVPTLASANSLGHANGCIIKVPSSLLNSWQTATNWSALANITWQGV